ncbi:hypothetical protein HJC23_005051 [Cyclotella cryptica]|uniref:LRRK2 ARM repeat domain-containing protein n=1 Tax=Cyclotella cryptica TaxID=29204 RepID=A0ABD3QDD9_9STRA
MNEVPPQITVISAGVVIITNLSMLMNQSQVKQLHDESIESLTSGSNHSNIIESHAKNLGVTRIKKMKTTCSSKEEKGRAVVRQDEDIMTHSQMDFGSMFLGDDASARNALGQSKPQSDSNVNRTTAPSAAEPARQTSSSITSSNSNSGSVTFALPATIATSSNRQASNRSYNSEASSGSLSSSGGENAQTSRPALKVHTNLSTANVAAANRISGSSNASSNRGSNTSGSGSDGGGNNTSSTSNNNPVVTAGTATTTTANSNNSSGSGSDGGSGGSGNRRSGGEASNDYYYAGYGSGSLATNGSSLQARPYHHRQEAEGAVSTREMIGMPSFASFRGASIAAAAAELNNERNDGNHLPPPPPLAGALLGPQGIPSRHVVVAADEASNPPNFAYTTSHLRHHSRHVHHRRVPNVPAAAAAAAQAGQASPVAGLNGIPSAIGPAGHHNVPAPPAVENALPRGLEAPQHEQHVTVVASNVFPPPLTLSDAWSSASSSRSAARRETRKRPIAATAAAAAAMTSTTRAGGASLKTNPTNSSMDSASSAKSSAVHVSTDDPILKPSMFSHGTQKKVVIKSNAPLVKSLESPVKSLETTKIPAPVDAAKSGGVCHKRKASMLVRCGGASDDSSDGGSRSDNEAVGSGSEEGYEASSSSNAERQSGSGSSGSDSVSSDDANKNKVAKTRNSTSLSNPGKKTTSMESHSGKRTETSSMSSSVLADFSSGVNEDVNSFSSSPNSSCMSLNELEDVNKAKLRSEGKAAMTMEGGQPMAMTQTESSGRKRDLSHLGYASSNHRKRSHHDAELKDTDVDMSTKGNALKRGLALMEKSLQQKVRSANHHHYHSRSTGRKMLEESFLSAKRNLSSGSSPDDAKFVTASALGSSASSVSVSALAVLSQQEMVVDMTSSAHRPMKEVSFQDTLIYSLGADVMALVVSFLEVPESHTLLTSPLSKTWLETYTVPQELWKIMCTSRPFYAKLEENPDGSSDVSTCSFPLCNDLQMRHLFGRYRLLYSSFVRCMKYLDRLRDDALNGRTPTVYNNSSQHDLHPYNRNGSLKAYFARARRLVRRNRRNGGSSSIGSDSVSGSLTTDSGEEQKLKEKFPAGSSSSEHSLRDQQNASGPRTARSMLTDRLLRPTRAGDVDNVNLPWSCAIYSVVNWMVAFVDVEGIQIMCLKVLPYLLEDETQRTTAQRAGLTDSVLRAMVIFPDSIELHTAAFHTLVLLARPLGGNEGMLFHTAMVNTRGIFNSGGSTNTSKNGIVIMLDSMRRFAQDEMLQAMSCWSLVNVALTPLQKSMLVKLGGLTVTANAMLQHPYNAEVQFRALFALINLVIPSEVQTEETEEQREFEREIFQQLGEVGETSEREMLDASVGQISNLVVVAMKNFCSSEAILNRACLVLHNLSLNEEYHSILLWTPNCYQMLEWCIGNYPHDHVLQQSAGGTITRLNATLSADDELRARFTHSIRAQQQHSLELARREAVYLQEQQQEQFQQQND